MLTGAYTALVTPFDSNGEIDFPAVARLLAWHEHSGMDGVLIAGTNGEGPSLSAVEKRDLVRAAVEHAGNLKVIAGLGTPSLTEAIWLSDQAQKAGAAASLVLPPYYFPATESGIEQWFRALLESSDLPCILYNFPKTTGVTLSPALLRNVFTYPHAVGVKDSSGDPDLLTAYLEVAKEKQRIILVGDERLLLRALRNGGAGTISGLANSLPVLVSRQVRERSDTFQQLIDEAVAALKKHPQPAVHKCVLDHRGLPGGPMRPPLEPLSHDAAEEVCRFIDRFGF
ncbi:MAG: dihydrodipicolinate synthase family protein [Armatimonadetes bacterium]|nr:dihydrodipicolinate synthase family protein [Armatimonadota bacterium]